MSSLVLLIPKLKRKDSATLGLSSPYIAANTWEGSNEPAVHAEPAAAEMPLKSRLVNKLSLASL